MEFTKKQINAAKKVRDTIIREDIEEWKSIYMAGEICMWDKLQQDKVNEDSTSEDKALILAGVRLSLPTTKELREARELYELQVKSNSMMNKPISGHWQEGVEWVLSRIIEGNEA